MKVYNVSDAEFKDYGCTLEKYNFCELFKNLQKTTIPDNEIIYESSEKSLETCKEAKKLQERGFGGYPIQLGYVNGKNRLLNCLEYHKSSEFNIAMNDIILVLGLKKEIINGSFDSSLCKAFFVPAGTGVELYSTTLHYAPFNISKDGYRVICVLPKKTNMQKIEFDTENIEDKMYFGINKWLMAHKDSNEAKKNAYIGIKGKNISFDMLDIK